MELVAASGAWKTKAAVALGHSYLEHIQEKQKENLMVQDTRHLGEFPHQKYHLIVDRAEMQAMLVTHYICVLFPNG